MSESRSGVLSITAPGNGSGKTQLAVTLLRAFPGTFTVLKVSTVYRDGGNCPTEGSACACRRLHGDYAVLTDPGILHEDETDTGRFHRAGASRILWCLARPDSHRAAWREISGTIGSDQPLITEGNRIASVVNPDALVMVVHPDVPRVRWKKDTGELAGRADLIVVNAGSGDSGEPVTSGQCESLASELRRGARGPVIVQDISRPLADWTDRTLQVIVGRLLEPRAGIRAVRDPRQPAGS